MFDRIVELLEHHGSEMRRAFEALNRRLDLTDQAIADLTAEETELETAVANLDADVKASTAEQTAAAAEIVSLLASVNPTNDPAIEAIVAKIKTQVDTINTEATNLSTATTGLASAIPPSGGGPPPAPPPPVTITVEPAVFDTVPTLGAAFSQQLVFTGGSGGGYQPSIASGALPSGLSMSAGGLISGTPDTAGPWSVVIQVHDANNSVGSQGYNGTV